MSKNIIDDVPVAVAVGPILRPGDSFLEENNRNNGTRLVSGNHEVISLEKPATTISSDPDAVVTKQTSADSSSIIYGATYECDGDQPAALIKATGSTVFVGCHFVKDANTQEAASSYVQIESGGAALFVGCYFHNVQAAGFTVNNAGGATKVKLVGCFIQTGRPDNNTTRTGEVLL
jgi:hypothetical protein|tara:strand:+ start:120 stop:647 length:528 start_codon:yes stop_codon:yes gene_type:complete